VQGVYSVLPTPFTANGDIDHDSLRRVVDMGVAAGVDGFTALGVTSEVARFTDAERVEVLDTVIAAVDGRAQVVAGTTAEGLRTCIEYSRRAKAAGAAP
jgi:4-hydroxy-tetrahydrodipicolinate synthase